MVALAFLVIGLIQAAIAVYLFRHYSAKKVLYTLLVMLVVEGLAYDALAISAGAILQEGALLRNINWLRFALHALLTPLMVIAIVGIARRMGLGWAQTRLWHIIFCVAATLLILVGVGMDLIGLTLEPNMEWGVLRYADPESVPPIPSILTIVIAIVVGGMLWRKRSWPWLCLGGIVMFVASALTPFMPILGNVGEIFFALAMAVSEVRANDGVALAKMNLAGSKA